MYNSRILKQATVTPLNKGGGGGEVELGETLYNSVSLKSWCYLRATHRAFCLDTRAGRKGLFSWGQLNKTVTSLIYKCSNLFRL